MGTGIAAGLWDVVTCEKTANFLCKQRAVGVLPSVPPVQVPAAACAEGWDGASWADSCFKVSVCLPSPWAWAWGSPGVGALVTTVLRDLSAGSFFGNDLLHGIRVQKSIKYHKSQQWKTWNHENRVLGICFLLFKCQVRTSPNLSTSRNSGLQENIALCLKSRQCHLHKTMFLRENLWKPVPLPGPLPFLTQHVILLVILLDPGSVWYWWCFSK